MINFSIRHSLNDIIPNNEKEFEFVGGSIEHSALLVSKDRENCEIIRFLMFPPQISTIFKGQVEDDISNINIFPDKRVMWYSHEKNIIFVDLLNENSKRITLQNTTLCSPIFATKNEDFFIFERNSTLFQSSLKLSDKDISLSSSRGSSLIKNVVWWDVHIQSKLVACITSNSSGNRFFHAFQYRNKLTEIFDFEMPAVFENIQPIKFFLVNSYTFILANVTETSTLIVTYPSLKVACIPYNKTENVKISLVNEILVINVPNTLIALVDADGGQLITRIIEDKELLCNDSLNDVVQSSQESSIFFDPKNLCFISLEIDWTRLSKLLTADDILAWHFVAHLSAAHTPVTFFIQDIIKTTPLDFPIGIMNFFLEYCVSGVYQWLSPDTPLVFRKYIPHMTTLTSIMEDEPSEASILQALKESCEFFIPIDELIKTQFWQDLMRIDNDFCPKGFWKQSTNVYLILFYLAARTTRQKFIPPLCNLTLPFLNVPSLQSDHLRALKEITQKQTIDFLSDYIKKLCAVSQAIPAPSDAKPIEKLRYEISIFAVARRFHIPYNIRKLPILESLILQETPKFLQYIYTRDRVLQTPDCFAQRPDLWIRSAISPHGDALPYFDINERHPSPLDVEYMGTSTASCNKAIRENPDYFSPFIPYKLAVERIADGNNDDMLRQSINVMSQKYTIENLSKYYL